jgi:hypothetical protein
LAIEAFVAAIKSWGQLVDPTRVIARLQQAEGLCFTFHCITCGEISRACEATVSVPRDLIEFCTVQFTVFGGKATSALPIEKYDRFSQERV